MAGTQDNFIKPAINSNQTIAIDEIITYESEVYTGNEFTADVKYEFVMRNSRIMRFHMTTAEETIFLLALADRDERKTPKAV